MNCPFDDTELKVVEKNGIEIDWCSSCKGVWLERGELDKIIERFSYENSRDHEVYVRRDKPNWDYEEKYASGKNREHGYQKKKKSSFLSEIFEF